ncbi:hypothetical protein HOF65_02945 [bacterium]|nr:hypothetical protein [bacterium]MBT3852954.1 hypothetical protein [bacterium]MBT6779023.1 hypothetical protein [bacterium]
MDIIVLETKLLFRLIHSVLYFSKFDFNISLFSVDIHFLLNSSDSSLFSIFASSLFGSFQINNSQESFHISIQSLHCLFKSSISLIAVDICSKNHHFSLLHALIDSVE